MNILNKNKVAYFAAGCFWGVQYYFDKLEGVVKTTVGYMGGEKQEPNYQQVCGGTTGHLEAIEVVYDSEKTDFEKVCKYFLRFMILLRKMGKAQILVVNICQQSLW